MLIYYYPQSIYNLGYYITLCKGRESSFALNAQSYLLESGYKYYDYNNHMEPIMVCVR